MKLQTLKSIIEKKKNKSEFAIITNLTTGESEIFEKNKPLSKEMETYSSQIEEFFKSKKKWSYRKHRNICGNICIANKSYCSRSSSYSSIFSRLCKEFKF